MGVWIVRHVGSHLVVAAIRIAGCLFLVAIHIHDVDVESLLGVENVEESLGGGSASADRSRRIT
jgi:hypothetical protein